MKRLRRIALALLFLVSVGLVGLYVFRSTLVVPHVIERARTFVAERYGAQLTIGAIGGNWFSDVVVEDLSWTAPEPPLLELEASVVRVEYSLFGLLTGAPDWLRAIEAEVQRAELAAAVPNPDPPPSPAPPSSLPPVNATVAELSYRVDDERTVAARDARVRIAPQSGADALELEIAAVTFRDPKRELTGALRARGSYDAGRIEIQEASFGEMLRVSGLRTTLGEGRWQKMLREAVGHVELRLDDEWQVAVDMEFALGRAKLLGDVRTSGGSLNVQRGELTLGTAPGQVLEGAALDVLLDADFEDIGPLAARFGLEWSGSLKGSLDLEGPVLSPTGELTAIARDIDVGTFELETAELEVRSDGRGVEIVRCDFASGPWQGSLTGNWSGAERAFDAVSVRLSGGGKELFRGFAPDVLDVSLTAAGPPAALVGHFEAAGSGVPLGPLGDATLEASGDFEGSKLRLERFLLAQDDRVLRLAGSGGALDGGYFLDLDQLQFSGGAGALELEAPARLAWREGLLRIDGLLLRSEVEGRTGRLEASTVDLALDVLLDDFDPSPLLELAGAPVWSIQGLHGTIIGSIDPLAPDVTADLEVRGFVPVPDATAYDFALRGALTPEGTLDAVLEGSSDEVKRLHVELRAPFDLARAGELFPPGDVRIALEAEELRLDRLDALLGTATGVSGSARASLELAGSWRNLAGGLTVKATGVRTPQSDAALDQPAEVELEVELGDSVVLRRAELRIGGRAHASLAGRVNARFDLRGWLADPALLMRAPLELEADVQLPLAGWTDRTRAIRRLDGLLEGQVSIGGTAREPNFGGRIRLRDGELRLTSAFPAIRGMNADIELNGTALEIVELKGEIGAAPCAISGRIEWTDAGLVVDLGVKGENLLLARSSQLKVRANAEFTLRGPIAGLELAGEMLITEGRMARDIDLLASLEGRSAGPGRGIRPSFWSQPPLSDMRLDVRVRTTTDFDLRGNLYRVIARPDLFVRGTGDVPVFEGALFIGDSTVLLPSGTARITSGVLRTTKDRPFTPDIALSIETRVRGYDITAQVSGRIDEPEILLSSLPPLPNDRLLVLFLTGQLTGTESEGPLGAAESVGVYLAQDYLARMLFGDSVESQENVLDRLEFEVGTDVSRSGAPTMRATYFLQSHRAREGRTTYLRAERDKYDRTNYGFGIRFRFR